MLQRLFFLLLFSIFLAAQSAFGQQTKPETTTLETGKSFERQISAGQKHEYQIALEQNQCLEFVISARESNAALTITSPQGNQLMEFGAADAEGARQSVLLVANASGNYIFTVKTPEQAMTAGHYEIKVKDIRAAAEKDRNLATAFLLHLNGKKLHADGKYNEALAEEEKSLAIVEQNGGGDADIADITNEIAWILGDQGDYPNSGRNYLRALGIYEKINGAEHPFVASVLNNLGANYRMMGEFDKAEAVYQRALAIDEKRFGAENLKVSTILGNLAYLYYVKGDYSRAEEPYRRELAIEEKLLKADDFDIAVTTNNMALLYRVKGDYSRAIASFQRTAAIAEKVLPPDHPKLATMLSNLASTYSETGDYERAEPLFQRALKIREKVPGADSPDYAAALGNLGTLYYNEKDYLKAEQFFLNSLAIREKKLGADHPLTAATLSNLADVYRTAGDYEKAAPLLQRASVIVEKKFGAENSNVAPVIVNLGNLYLQKGDYAQAEPLLRRSLAIFENTNGVTHPFTARPLASLAQLYAAKGDFKTALDFQQKYLAVREHNLELNLYTGSERQKLAYIETLSQDLSSTISLHTQLMPQSEDSKRTALELLLIRKGRTLDAMGESIFTLRRNAQSEDQNLINHLSDLRTRLANLTLKGAGSDTAEQYRKKLAAIEDDKEKLEDEMSRRSAEFRVQSLPVTLEKVSRSIPPNTALLEFIEYKQVDFKLSGSDKTADLKRYAVYILRPNGKIEWQMLGDADAIDRAVADLRQALRDPKRSDVQQLARAVDAKIMQPVRALLGDAKQLLVSPDGELNLIPFEALVDEQNRYLIENYSFTYLTSGRDLLRMQTARTGKSKSLLIANPQFGESVAEQAAASNQTRIKSARQTSQRDGDQKYVRHIFRAACWNFAGSARSIQTLFPDATFLTGTQATETALKQANAPQHSAHRHARIFSRR